MVTEGEAFGHGTKMISFFDPSPDETNTEVRMTFPDFHHFARISLALAG